MQKERAMSTVTNWSIASDGVDPHRVPQRRLYTGATMPAIGLGTFGSDHVTWQEVAEAVKGAAAVGYRHLDCTTVYGNEHLDRPGAAGDHGGRRPARGVVDHLQALERQTHQRRM